MLGGQVITDAIAAHTLSWAAGVGAVAVFEVLFFLTFHGLDPVIGF